MTFPTGTWRQNMQKAGLRASVFPIGKKNGGLFVCSKTGIPLMVGSGTGTSNGVRDGALNGALRNGKGGLVMLAETDGSAGAVGR